MNQDIKNYYIENDNDTRFERIQQWFLDQGINWISGKTYVQMEYSYIKVDDYGFEDIECITNSRKGEKILTQEFIDKFIDIPESQDTESLTMRDTFTIDMRKSSESQQSQIREFLMSHETGGKSRGLLSKHLIFYWRINSEKVSSFLDFGDVERYNSGPLIISDQFISQFITPTPTPTPLPELVSAARSIYQDYDWQVGEIYHVLHGDANEYIIEYSTGKLTLIKVKYSSFTTNAVEIRLWENMHPYTCTIRPATEQQRGWLMACKNVGEFVSLESVEQVSVEIPDKPEIDGYNVLEYRLPKKGESYWDYNFVEVASYDFAYAKTWIVEKLPEAVEPESSPVDGFAVGDYVQIKEEYLGGYFDYTSWLAKIIADDTCGPMKYRIQYISGGDTSVVKAEFIVKRDPPTVPESHEIVDYRLAKEGEPFMRKYDTMVKPASVDHKWGKSFILKELAVPEPTPAPEPEKETEVPQKTLDELTLDDVFSVDCSESGTNLPIQEFLSTQGFYYENQDETGLYHFDPVFRDLIGVNAYSHQHKPKRMSTFFPEGVPSITEAEFRAKFMDEVITEITSDKAFIIDMGDNVCSREIQEYLISEGIDSQVDLDKYRHVYVNCGANNHVPNYLITHSMITLFHQENKTPVITVEDFREKFMPPQPVAEPQLELTDSFCIDMGTDDVDSTEVQEFLVSQGIKYYGVGIDTDIRYRYVHVNCTRQNYLTTYSDSNGHPIMMESEFRQRFMEIPEIEAPETGVETTIALEDLTLNDPFIVDMGANVCSSELQEFLIKTGRNFNKHVDRDTFRYLHVNCNDYVKDLGRIITFASVSDQQVITEQQFRDRFMSEKSADQFENAYDGLENLVLKYQADIEKLKIDIQTADSANQDLQTRLNEETERYNQECEILDSVAIQRDTHYGELLNAKDEIAELKRQLAEKPDYKVF